MTTAWVQNGVVILAVGACVFIVVRKAWRTLHGKGGGSCGCESCPAGEPPGKQVSKEPTVFFNPLENIELEKSPTSDKRKIRLLG